MNDVDLALSQISNIRAQMAANTRFLGLSPEFNMLMGCLAFVIMLVQMFYPPLQDNLHYIALWFAVLVATSGIATLDAISRGRRYHGRRANAMLGALLYKFFPFALAFTVLTWVICQFALDSLWILPGLWQMLLALMGFAVLSNLPRALTCLVGWYFLCSVVVLVVAAQTKSLSPWMMGVPFAFGQVAAGLILIKTREGQRV